MIDWGEGLIISVYILVTYIGIKIINRLFERTDNKKKNSLF